ncbi:MAG: CBM9 family sugar-binding protein [Cocleimonas sp.]|nr:CBM9 family sugar-binding protein [Cocleimonas sp.]
MSYRMITTLGLALLLVTQTTITFSADNNRSPLGINSNEVMDDDASVPFVDVFRASVPFEEARPWLTKGKIKYDTDGWPVYIPKNGQVGTRFINKLPAGTAPDGLYTVLYEGRGKLTYGNDAKLVRRTPGKDIVSIKAGKDKELRGTLIINKTDPNNHIRNIRILMPGGICSNNPYKRVYSSRSCSRGGYFMSFEKHHASIIFNPDYLNYMKDFKVIRFMNMAGITRNPISAWNERNTMSQQTWGGKPTVRGAPLEIMVELANQTGSDPWFCLPHKATNDYIYKFASYVRKHLRPGLKVYVEYTNEAWNTIFTQAHYVKDKGGDLRLDPDRAKAGYKYYSMRSVQIFNIWEKVFGSTQRIVRVMGSWTGYTRMSEMLLTYRDAYKKTDALAIGPYFYPKKTTVSRFRSVNDVFKALYDKKEIYSIPGVMKLIRKQAKIAKDFGVDLIAYEGGQHLVDWKSRSIHKNPTKLFIQANRDWRMAKAYKDFFRGWKKEGGKLFVNFSAPRTSQWFGSWGTKEYLTQPLNKAPKHRAILQFIRSNRCWWKGCASRHIARLKKPSVNPGRGVFAKVKNGKKSNYAKAPGYKKKSTIVAKKKTATIVRKAPAPKRTISKASVNRPRKVVKPTYRPPVVARRSQSAYRPDAVIKRDTQPGKWNHQSAIKLSNIIGGGLQGSKDLSAVWQAKWDNHYLHIRVDTLDDYFVRDSVAPWGDDSIEVYIDADGSRRASFDGKNDFHFIFRWKDNKVSLSSNSAGHDNMGIKQTMTRSDSGMILEASIPWRSLGVRPSNGHRLGIDIQVNDDDNGSDRDTKLAWHATNDDAWENPQRFGRLILGI